MARFAYLLLVAAALASIQVAHADGYVWKPDYKPDYKPVHKPSPSPAPAFVAGTCKDTGYCFPKPLAASPSCPSGTQALPNDASLCWKGSCPAGSPLSHDEHGKPVCLSCPKGYFPDGSYCRQDCPKGYEFDGHEFCVKQCPKGYTSYEHGGKQYCIENCDRGEVAYANVCINIKKWHSNACTKGCSSPRPTKFPTDVYSIVDSAFAPMLRAFDSITDAAGLNSLADALANDGESYGSKDVFSAAVYGAVAQKSCKCNAVRERHVQQVERRTCNKKPFIVSPVWITSPTCPSTCTISADRRSCSCAVAPCPSGLVPCTAGWKQAPICVTPNKIYGVEACTVFTCPAVYAELDKSKACVVPVPAPAPTPGYYQG